MTLRRVVGVRRRWLLAAPAWLAGCSVLPSRPYLDQREWPLSVRRPVSLPLLPQGPTLLVRTLRAAPGLETRGLQTLDADGSIHTAFYEQWNVPPGEAVEDDLRRWLEAAGLFAAVLAPGTQAAADLALEGELQSLVAVPERGVSRAALGITLLDLHPAPIQVLLQTEVTAQAALAGTAPEQVAQSGQAAVAALLTAVEQRVAAALPTATTALVTRRQR